MSRATNQRTVAMPEDLLLQMLHWVADALQSLGPRISLGAGANSRDVKDLAEQLRSVHMISDSIVDVETVADDFVILEKLSLVCEQPFAAANSDEMVRQSPVPDADETEQEDGDRATSAEEEIVLPIAEQLEQLKSRTLRRCAERVFACKLEAEAYQAVKAFAEKHGLRAKELSYGWIDSAAESAELLRVFRESDAKLRGDPDGPAQSEAIEQAEESPEKREDREAIQKRLLEFHEEMKDTFAAEEEQRINLDGKSLGCCLLTNWDGIASAENPGDEEISDAMSERWQELKSRMLRARRERAAASAIEDAACLAVLDFAVEHGDAAWALAAEWIHRTVGAVELRKKLLVMEHAEQRNLAYRLRPKGELRRKIDEEQRAMDCGIKALRGRLVAVDRRKARLRREHQTPGYEAVRHWGAREPCGKWDGGGLRFVSKCNVCGLTGVARADNCRNFSQHWKWLDGQAQVYGYS